MFIFKIQTFLFKRMKSDPISNKIRWKKQILPKIYLRPKISLENMKLLKENLQELS